jgi:hypothetical protein
MNLGTHMPAGERRKIGGCFKLAQMFEGFVSMIKITEIILQKAKINF